MPSAPITVLIAAAGVFGAALVRAANGAAQPTAVRAPTLVSGIAGATQAAVGNQFYLVLLNDGRVLSWGSDSTGQLGRGTPLQPRPRATPPPGPNLAPAPVVDLANIVSIAAGAEHAIAVRSDGTVWAWGNNDENQLGLGKESRGTSRAVAVPGISSATAVAAYGSASYALLRDGSVLAWGEHLWRVEARSQRDRDIGSASPVRVPGVTGAATVCAGLASLALMRDGTVLSWGSGYLGDGSAKIGAYSEVPPQPVRVSGITDAIAIATGSSSSGVLRRDGSVWVWG